MGKFYTYKITFPGFKWYYYGYHKYDGKPYFGSPVTHKWVWDFYDCEVQILEWFENRDDAINAERRLIRPFLKDPDCLNEHCGGHFGDAALKKSLKTRRENKIGVFAPDYIPPGTFETCSAGGKVGGKFPWWNNGSQNTRSLGCPGEGWAKGRLVAWRWFNDGVKNIRARECPEGCSPGRLMPRNKEGKFI